MSWVSPYFHPVIISALFLLLSLFLCSIYYHELVKRKRFEKSIALAIMLGLVTIIILLTRLTIHLQLQFQSHYLALIYVVILIIVFIKQFLFFKQIKVSSTEFELDGIKFRIFTGSEINAFYRPLRGTIYLHQDLLGILTPDELKGILQHEMGHRLRWTHKFTLTLQLLTLFAVTLWLFGGLVLIAIVGHLFSMLLLYVMFGQYVSEAIKILDSLITLYLVLSSVSLILTSASWAWEQDADLYASEKVGTDVYASALIKLYLARSLSMESRYAKLKGCSINISLDNIPPLTLLDIAKELLLQTLLPLGLIDALIKPLERTHPPLHLRLRALRHRPDLKSVQIHSINKSFTESHKHPKSENLKNCI